MARENNIFPFQGTWIAKDGRDTDVEFQIVKRGSKVTIRAVDSNDGERAEIYGVPLAQELRFCALWSTGRFTKYRLRTLGTDELVVTFSYSATDYFRRAPKRKR